MSYKIVLTNGTQLFDLTDGVVDRSHTSIGLVGKNSVNFGQIQNTDLVHMLENFSNEIEPAHPLIGQLWYNTANNSLNVYNNAWQPLAAVSYSATAPAVSMKGNFWFDTSINQLKINNGTNFSTIGPEAVAGFDTTRFVSSPMLDASGYEHVVINCTLNGEVIAIMSAGTFVPLYKDAIPGFPMIYRRMTFKDDAYLKSTISSSLSANTLLSENGVTYVSASSSTVANSIAQRTPTGGIDATKLTASEVYSPSGIISGNWGITATIAPSTNAGASLGTPERRWAHVYSNSFDVGSVSSSLVNSTSATVANLTFVNLSDSFNHSVSNIDADATLSANSDTHLSTQKAIKAYIDKRITDAVAAIAATDNSLQTQITNLGLPIPSGTVLYHAGTTAPSGYLAADGSSQSIDQYQKLYLALGGVKSPYGQTSTRFNLPDLRGQFIRSLGEPGRTIGSIQDSANKSHGHLFDDIRWSEIDGAYTYTDPQLGAISVGPGAGSNRGTDYDNGVHFIRHGTYNTGDTESRPSNVALLAIIKI